MPTPVIRTIYHSYHRTCCSCASVYMDFTLSQSITNTHSSNPCCVFVSLALPEAPQVSLMARTLPQFAFWPGLHKCISLHRYTVNVRNCCVIACIHSLNVWLYAYTHIHASSSTHALISPAQTIYTHCYSTQFSIDVPLFSWGYGCSCIAVHIVWKVLTNELCLEKQFCF